MTRKSTIVAIGFLLIGYLLGASSLRLASADEATTSINTPQGDLLRVCIDKKSGTMRAVSKCKPSEKSYVLGGPGPQGAVGEKGEQGIQGAQGIQGQKGDTGAQGIQGPKGDTGLQGLKGDMGPAGPAGSLSGLRTATIDFVTGYYFNWCNGTGHTVTIGQTTLPACSVRVYVP